MRKFGHFMFGIMLGGILGSAIAILFAPASGEKARDEIKAYLTNLKDEVSRAADEKRAELEMELNRLRSGEKVMSKESS